MPFEKLYFGKRKALTAFGLYLQWKKSQEAKRYFKNLLFDICQEYSWCLTTHLEIKNNGFLKPRDTIDLFAAETAQTLAKLLVLFKDCVEPFLVDEIKRNIQQRILTPFENQKQDWESLENNWSAVCGSCVGITALILDPKPEILNRCKQALIAYLRGFGDDGCCTEGISYWVYGFGYYTYFADISFSYR